MNNETRLNLSTDLTEADMAQLVGLSLQQPAHANETPSPTLNTQKAQSVSGASSGDEASDLEIAEPVPEAVKSFSGNPWHKFSLVASGTGMVFGLLALLIFSFGGGNSESTFASTESELTPEEAANRALRAELDSQKQEVGRLLRDQAITQTDADRFSESLALAQQKAPQPSSSNHEDNPTSPANIRTVSAPPPPSSLATHSRRDRTTTPRTIASAPTTFSSTNRERPNRTALVRDSSPIVANQPPIAEPLEPKAPLALHTASQPQLIPGTQAEATLTSLVAWLPAMAEHPQADKSFSVELQEPLKTANGEIVVDAGSTLNGEIASIDENGLVFSTLTSVIQNGRIVPIPEGSIALKQLSGQPLLAQSCKIDNGECQDSHIAALDVLPIIQPPVEILVNDVLARTNQEDSTIIDRMAGGLLQGAVSDLSRRGQQARAERDAKPNFWYLDKGTVLQVVVTQPISGISPVAEENDINEELVIASSHSISRPDRHPEIVSTPDDFSLELPPPIEEAYEIVEVSDDDSMLALENAEASLAESEQPQTSTSVETFSQTDAEQHQPGIEPKDSVIQLSSGGKTEISFAAADERIQKIWVQDDSLVRTEFDTEVIHLSQPRSARAKDIPESARTKLTVQTQTADGRSYFYKFELKVEARSAEDRQYLVPRQS
ncbi:MAG: hypothetical protein AAFV90_25250 [Cyanobacteria bacterium J06634_5]